jgi:hypothetical protein
MTRLVEGGIRLVPWQAVVLGTRMNHFAFVGDLSLLILVSISFPIASRRQGSLLRPFKAHFIVLELQQDPCY